MELSSPFAPAARSSRSNFRAILAMPSRLAASSLMIRRPAQRASPSSINTAEFPNAQAALKQALSWNAQAATAPVKPEPGHEVSPKPTAPAGNPLEASAYRALNSGRLDEAERQFQEILDKQPNNPRALSGMGYVYMKRQDFGSAADSLERALSQLIGLRQSTISMLENSTADTRIGTLYNSMAALDLELVIRPRTKSSAQEIETLF